MRLFGTYTRIFSIPLRRFFTSINSLVDILSTRILWLSMGVILAVLARNFTKSLSFIWGWLVTSLILGFSRTSLFYFYIFFEIRLIPILLIILSGGRQPERLSAGSYLLFYTTVIRIPYLTFILLIDKTGIFGFTSSSSWRIRGIALLLLVPFLIKIPIFGFHFWLPKAHVEARTRGSIVLAGILLKLGRYGAIRVILTFSVKLSSSWFSRVLIFLAFISRVVTFIQRDLKKMVAYRRVTHITFIIIGFITRTKLMLVRVALVSLSHGWAAIAIFARAGTLRQSASSRLGYLLGSEIRLFWLILVLGLILVLNAGIPPILSFFPELLLVLLGITTGGYSMLLFLGLSLIVCYYNAYLYIWISHIKHAILLRVRVSFLERIIILIILIIRMESLLWLSIF